MRDQFGLDRADWTLLERQHPNVLVIGPDETVEAFCDVLRRSIVGPSVSTDGRQFCLPQSCRTLFIMNVGLLNVADQLRLLDWLANNRGKAQTIATSPFPVFPLLEQHVMIDSLYYRLNVMTVVLQALRPAT